MLWVILSTKIIIRVISLSEVTLNIITTLLLNYLPQSNKILKCLKFEGKNIMRKINPK